MYLFVCRYFLPQAKLPKVKERVLLKLLHVWCTHRTHTHTLVDGFSIQRHRHMAAATSSRTITLNVQYMAHKLMCLMLTRQLKMQINREPFVEHIAHLNRSSNNSTIFIFDCKRLQNMLHHHKIWHRCPSQY